MRGGGLLGSGKGLIHGFAQGALVSFPHLRQEFVSGGAITFRVRVTTTVANDPSCVKTQNIETRRE